MPELPELEALARAIDAGVAAAPVEGPPVAHFAVVKGIDPPLSGLAGLRLEGARRRAKHLLFPVEDGTTLAIHLMGGGRLALLAPGEKRPKAPVLLVPFADGGALVVTESGTKKRVRVQRCSPEGLATLLEGLGPEPLDDAFDRAALDAVLDAQRRQLHPFLRDQRAIAGIGRAFANEICWAARLSPFALTDRLPDDARERLLAAIREVLGEAIEACAANGTRLPTREKDDHRPLRIHRHEGQPCPRCGDTLRFVDFEEHRIVYCPTCQTDGRELADRRLSRLLR